MNTRVFCNSGEKAVNKNVRRVLIAGLILAVAILNAYGTGASRTPQVAGNGHARALLTDQE